MSGLKRWYFPESAALRFALPGIICILVGYVIFLQFGGLVDHSYRSHAAGGADPEELLRHADTWYWYGRQRFNAQPEFDTASQYASAAIKLAEQQIKSSGIDSMHYQSILWKATDIQKQTEVQRDITRFNLSTRYPFYMDIMGHEEDMMQEDADSEEMHLEALRGALDKLFHLYVPSRAPTLSGFSAPVLLDIMPNSVYGAEVLVQEIVTNSKLNYITPHDLSGIFGIDSVSVSVMVKDAAAMKILSEAIGAREIAVLSIRENDVVDGLYYYSLKMDLWSSVAGMSPGMLQSTYLIRDRVFNQLTILILPLFIFFLLLTAGIGLLNDFIAEITNKSKRITVWIQMVISFATGYAAYILIITYGFKGFLNPEPGEYYATDPAEQWSVFYPLSFVIAVPFVTYLLLGKLDNWISEFQSGLDRQAGVFAWLSGALLVFPASFTYYQFIRFGNTPEIWLFLPLTGLMLVMAWLISLHWVAIADFPQETSLNYRLFRYSGLGICCFVLWSLISALLSNYSFGVLLDWLATPIPAMALIWGLAGIWFKQSEFLFNHGRVPEAEISVKPDGIDSLTVMEKDGLLAVSRTGNGIPAAAHPVLFVRAFRKMAAFRPITRYLMRTGDRVVHIDFSCDRTGMENIHYPAYAKAFSRVFPYAKFNDVAETARKTSNLLGKLISNLSSIGGLLVDTGAVRARKPSELAALLLEKITDKPTILFLDKVEHAAQEDIDLLEAIISFGSIGEKHCHTLGRAPFPLIVVCGYGEFGLRDSLEAVISKAGREGCAGFEPWPMAYDHPTERSLELFHPRLPVQVRIRIERELRVLGMDISPEFADQVVTALRQRGHIQAADGPFDECVMPLNFSGFVSGISKGNLPEQFTRPGSIRDVLVVAAYLADREGSFRLPVLLKVTGMPKMEVLAILHQALKDSIVYDLRGEKYFDWFAFTDPEIAEDFRLIDNPRPEHDSQLAKECNMGYIDFHMGGGDESNLNDSLQARLASGEMSTDELFLAAERMIRVAPVEPRKTSALLTYAAKYLSSNHIARYEDALVILKHCRDLRKSPRFKFDAFNLKILEFTIRVEIGKVKTEQDFDILKLVSDIHESPEFNGLDTAVKQRIALLEALLMYLLFNKENRIHGEALCKSVLGENPPELIRIRAEFYLIKLIPGNDFNREKNTESVWVDRVTAVFRDYERLLMDARSIIDTQVQQLTGELLNDLAGFLTDKILGQFAGLDLNSPPALLINALKNMGFADIWALAGYIEARLRERVTMNTEVPASEDALSPAVLRSLMLSDKPGIDKRGLCYTYNYRTRSLLHIGEVEKALETGLVAYRLNQQSGDERGASMAAGSLGYGYEKMKDFINAFRWFERSFGHGSLMMAGNMMKVAAACDNSRELQAAWYVAYAAKMQKL